MGCSGSDQEEARRQRLKKRNGEAHSRKQRDQRPDETPAGRNFQPAADRLDQGQLLTQYLHRDIKKYCKIALKAHDPCNIIGMWTTNTPCYRFNFQANLCNQEASSTEFVQPLMTSVCLSTIDVRKWRSITTKSEFRENPTQLSSHLSSITFSTEVRGFAVPGGVHQLSGSKIIQRSEILKKYLNNGQKQREALKVLQNVLEQRKTPNSQCLSTFHYTSELYFYCPAFISPLEGGDYVTASVCGFVSYITRSYEQMLMKRLVNVDNCPKNRWLRFGVIPDSASKDERPRGLWSLSNLLSCEMRCQAEICMLRVLF